MLLLAPTRGAWGGVWGRGGGALALLQSGVGEAALVWDKRGVGWARRGFSWERRRRTQGSSREGSVGEKRRRWGRE